MIPFESRGGRGQKLLFSRALVCACLFAAKAAATDVTAADTLFREGRRLLGNGQVAEACKKFAESQRLDPSSGTLLNLANCDAQAGRTATAWSEFLAAAELAEAQQRPEHVVEAEKRAAELEPRLVRLTIRLSAPQPAGVVVLRNGEQVASWQLETPVPIDPGSHAVRAMAPGYRDWSTTVVMTQPGEVRAIEIPLLVRLPSPHPSASPPQRSASIRKPQRQAIWTQKAESEAPSVIPPQSWVAAGIGAAALASSALFAFAAKSEWDSAHDQDLCDTNHSCNREGMDQTDRARTLGNLATAGLAVGGVGLTTAVILHVHHASSRRARARVGLFLRPPSAALDLRGEF